MGKGLFLGEFEQVVLLAVARLDGNGYGMTIRREIERSSGRSVTIGPVYSTLTRLEQKGYVKSRKGEATPIRGGKATRHFEILPAGVKALRRARIMLNRMWQDLPFDPSPETP